MAVNGFEDVTSSELVVILKCLTTMQVEHYGKIENPDIREKWEMNNLEGGIQKLGKIYAAKSAGENEKMKTIMSAEVARRNADGRQEAE